MERGDRAWGRRAEGAQELRAAAAPIAEAIDAYQTALDADPESLEANWKLMRALFYQGRYVLDDRDEQAELYRRGRDAGEAAIDLLAVRAGVTRPVEELEVEEVIELLRGQEHAAPIFYWTGAHWGVWGEATGKMAAVRQGVAGKVRDYAEIVIGLDETFESAGAYRVLGRLHHEAPKVPFITGWIDRDVAVSSLERAVELAPGHPLSELYLVEALYEYVDSRRNEAVERLERLIEAGPRPGHPVEDGHTMRSARMLLAEWKQ
jgi:tetratricopeptide (TPR) repeat protein